MYLADGHSLAWEPVAWQSAQSGALAFMLSPKLRPICRNEWLFADTCDRYFCLHQII